MRAGSAHRATDPRHTHYMPTTVSVVQVGDPAPQMAHSIAIEQYVYWQRLGWTQHEMLRAVGRRYVAGMGGDDVIFELVMAWHNLDRGAG